MLSIVLFDTFITGVSEVETVSGAPGSSADACGSLDPVARMVANC